MGLLHLVARHGRLALVLGLLAGLTLPGLAAALRPYLPHLVALLLFLTALRVGPQAAIGAAGDLPRAARILVVLQLVLPLGVVALATALGWLQWPFVLAAALMLAAPSVTGAPNFAIMSGSDPAPAMRLLVLGTAVFPLTALPVLWLLPGLGGAGAAVLAALKLIVVILLSVGAGFALRFWIWRHLRADTTRALDGLAALALAVIVVGLMSAIGPLAREDPLRLLLWLAMVCSLNLGLQIFGLVVMRRAGSDWAVPVSIIAGNRNIALFLIALPGHVTDPLLIFIGCYQVPMYLTPLIMKPFHDRVLATS